MKRDRTPRERIVDLAVDLVLREGPRALTTTRIAKKARIAQPSFYAHFESLDECAAAVADVVGEDLRRLLRKARRGIDLSGDLREAISGAYVHALQTLLADRRLATILVRDRHAVDTAVGRRLKENLDRVREEMIDDFQDLARRMGAGDKVLARVPVMTEMILSLMLGALEALIEGRFDDPTFVARSLGHTTWATLTTYLERTPPA